MTIRFFLRSERKDQPVPIWVRVRTKTSDVSFALDAVIMPTIWDSKKGMPRPFNKETNEPMHRQSRLLTKYLNDLKDDIIVVADQCEEKGEKLTRDKLVRTVDRRKGMGEIIPRSIVPYLDWLIAQMRMGLFKNGAENYDPDTIRVWAVFRNIFARFDQEFEKATGIILVWSAIDKSVIDAFTHFLETSGYSLKTINKYLICLRAVIKYSCIHHHLHSNLDCLNYLHKRKEVEGCSKTKVYLNTEELQALYEMPIDTGTVPDQIRDIFLVGCYTCQRISDYNNLTRANFGTTAKGTRVVRLVQEKTGNSVVIPILNDNLQAIAEKYDYRLPHLNPIVFNRYIKRICKRLSESVPSLQEPVRTTLTLQQRQAEADGLLHFERDEDGNVVRPKYELVTSHSARRSGITNLYRSGLFTTRQLMSISGHKVESVFFSYIAESSDELADEIATIQAAANRVTSSNEAFF